LGRSGIEVVWYGRRPLASMCPIIVFQGSNDSKFPPNLLLISNARETWRSALAALAPVMALDSG
jgi:hypothetical protein